MPVAIVTGASRGFGRALAVDLAKGGWTLVIDGRESNALETVAQTLDDLGALVDAIVGDVTDPEHRAALIEAAKRRGSLDLLVNNASTLGPSPLPKLEDYSLEELRRVYEVNVFAPLALIQDDQLHRVLAVEELDVDTYVFDPGDMRTDMHQAAFPGEDISDRPEPESVVPTLRRLLELRPASGRFRSGDWLEQ